MSLQKIGFIGLGLIGGSIAKKLHALHPELTIIATAHHAETVAEAYKEHLIINNTPCELKDFADCDYIFLCTPTKKNIEYLQQLKDVISPDCIITDVGSVKTEIHREVIRLGLEANFIGGHPMAGSEKTGLSNASETLLENAYYIITPTTKSPSPAVEELTGLVRSLGAIPLVLGYEQHDYATAAISHLPHVIAYSLVNLVRESDDENEIMKTIAAGGFKDITRIASSSPVMWENICLSNQEQILKCYREDKIDIVFMDIEFGDTIGFQVARRLSRQDSQLAVVYTTNYEHYITEAFVCRPLGFIRKSHAEDDLQIAGQEIRHFIGQKYSRFVFGCGTAVVEVPLYKVYAVEIYGHDMVILLDDENICVRDKLMRVEDELEAHDFVKISRGRMVHLKYVTAIEGKTVRLHENYEFAVSADKISMLKSRWLAYKMLH